MIEHTASNSLKKHNPELPEFKGLKIVKLRLTAGI